MYELWEWEGGQEGGSPRTSPTRYVGETLAPSVWTPPIPYTSGQTATGGLSYSIPIALGPLVQLAPTLSLVYNSQAGDGVAGYGWSLAGLSSILPTIRLFTLMEELVAPRGLLAHCRGRQ